MFKTGDEVFLHIPDGTMERHLHRGRIVREWGERCLIEIKPTCTAPESGHELMLFSEMAGEFMRHAARVNRVSRGGPRPLVDLRIVSGPVSAERRRQQRVPFMSTYDATVRTLVQ